MAAFRDGGRVAAELRCQPHPSSSKTPPANNENIRRERNLLGAKRKWPHRPDNGRRLPPRLSCARSPTTASIISSANPGTDFPPIVEAFSRAKKTNAKVPKPILVPHENLAVAMAHGAYLMNGHPQAVMVHVNVGTANTINNLTNLSRDRVPLILAAGRTPITEKGSFGSRSRPIHWAQEMFDQAGMLRELVKWDYELRHARPGRRRGGARGGSGDGAPARAGLPGAAARAAVGAACRADRRR